VQFGRGQQPRPVERRAPQGLDGVPSSPVVLGSSRIPRQRPRGCRRSKLGLDIGGHVDVVDDEALEVATEVDVAAVAVDDLQTVHLAIADLEASEVAQGIRAPAELVARAYSETIEGQSRSPVPPAPRSAAGLAVDSMRGAGRRIDDVVLGHISSVHSENINFFGSTG